MWWNGRVYFAERPRRDDEPLVDGRAAAATSGSTRATRAGTSQSPRSAAAGSSTSSAPTSASSTSRTAQRRARCRSRLASDFDQLRENWVDEADRLPHLGPPRPPTGDRVVLTARGQVFVAPVGQGRLVEVDPHGRACATGRPASCRTASRWWRSPTSRGEVELWTLAGQRRRRAGAAHPRRQGAALRRRPLAGRQVDRLHGQGPRALAVQHRQEGTPSRWRPRPAAASPTSPGPRTAAGSPTSRRRANTFAVRSCSTASSDGTTIAAHQRPRRQLQPAWSPDGKWIYFLSDRNLGRRRSEPLGPAPARAVLRHADQDLRGRPAARPARSRSPRPTSCSGRGRQRRTKEPRAADKSAKARPPAEKARVDRRHRALDGLAGPALRGAASRRAATQPLAGRPTSACSGSRTRSAPRRRRSLAGPRDQEARTPSRRRWSRTCGASSSRPTARSSSSARATTLTSSTPAPASKPRTSPRRRSTSRRWRFSARSRARSGGRCSSRPGAWSATTSTTATCTASTGQGMLAKYQPLVDRVSDRAELTDLLGPDGRASCRRSTSSSAAATCARARTTSLPARSGARARPRRGGRAATASTTSTATDPDYPDSAVAAGAARCRACAKATSIAAVNGVAGPRRARPGAAPARPGRPQVLLARASRPPAARHATSSSRRSRPSGEAELRYDEWEYTRRAARRAGRQAARSATSTCAPWAAATTPSGRTSFYPVFDRKGLIIDVRHNRGGNIDTWILEKLLRKAWFYWQPRVGEPDLEHAVRLPRPHGRAVRRAHRLRRRGLRRGLPAARARARSSARAPGAARSGCSSSNFLVDSGIATAAETGVYGPGGRSG